MLDLDFRRLRRCVVVTFLGALRGPRTGRCHSPTQAVTR